MKQFIIITLIIFLAIASVLFAQGKSINLNDKNSAFDSTCVDTTEQKRE